MRNILIGVLFVLIILGVGLFVGQDYLVKKAFEPRQSKSTARTPVPLDNATTTPEKQIDSEPPIEPLTIVATDLEIPWDIGFLPNNDLVVTERPGHLVRIDAAGTLHRIEVDAVKHSGEGGLLGLALHPQFEENNWLYLYITGHLNTETQSGTENRVLRYVYRDDTLTEETVILEGIPGALFHNGGQIDFGPDNLLYIATGDARDPDLSQKLDSLAGKILRVTDEGTPVEDNPFFGVNDDTLGPAVGYVYSYGHRNAQGLAWDQSGQLWSTEHGRSGVLSGLDELNRVTRAGNYGWPNSQGDEVNGGTLGPVIHSGPDVTWAPASLAFWKGDPYPHSLFFGGLRGQTLYEVVIGDEISERIETADPVVSFKEHFFTEYGRIRAAVVGPDNMLYISTSNQDGRGTPQAGDDKIIRIDPRQL